MALIVLEAPTFKVSLETETFNEVAATAAGVGAGVSVGAGVAVGVGVAVGAGVSFSVT